MNYNLKPVTNRIGTNFETNQVRIGTDGKARAVAS